MPQNEGTMKNRDLLPIGTRVKPAHDKLSKRIGTVVEYTEGNDPKMYVHWDGDFIAPDVPRIIGPFMRFEIKEIK